MLKFNEGSGQVYKFSISWGEAHRIAASPTSEYKTLTNEYVDEWMNKE